MSETYILKKPVLIKTNGSEYLVEDIEIEAPTGRIQNLFARLEAEYSKLQKIISDDAQKLLQNLDKETLAATLQLASLDGGSAKPEEEQSEPTIEDQVKDFLKQVKTSGFNLTTSYGILKEILTQKKGGSAKMIADGETFKMESGHWDNIPMKEIKNLLGFYIRNFIDSSD